MADISKGVFKYMIKSIIVVVCCLGTYCRYIFRKAKTEKNSRIINDNIVCYCDLAYIAVRI